jgi:hypothetical protein
VLSRTFFQEKFECKVTALYGVEDKDIFLLPSLSWKQNDNYVELSAGFFGGDEEGELGQYRNNDFLKAILTYTF